jgi:hypothetical protein
MTDEGQRPDLVAEALGDWLTEATGSAYADMEPEELTDWAIVTTRLAHAAGSPQDRNRAAAVFHAVMTELGRRRLIVYSGET